MSILKVRDLAKYGVLADIDPYELPSGAFSFAVNARFINGKIERAPVWRKAGTTATVDPRYAFSAHLGDGSDTLFIGYKNGRVYKWANGTETNYTLSGYVNSSAEATWTDCSLGGVCYVNRSDRVPWGLIPGASLFTTLTGWSSTWTAKILRSYNSALVALNITKSGVNSPTMVKVSDIVTDPSINPSTWDQTDTTANAVENNLTEMKGAIVDAAVLGDSLIIYGTSQNWIMRADGSENVYSFDRLPFDGGAINANCSVEVNGQHYVFGPNDCYKHDGLSKVSVIDGKNRTHLYGTMNASKASHFFVVHNPNLETISFNYVGQDAYTAFSGGVGCNRAAVLHVPTGIWTFDDTPFVHAGVISGISINSPTWATATATWDTVGGTWQDLEDGFKKAPVYVGEANATIGLSDALYVSDPYGKGSVVSAPVDTVATAAMYLERTGIDLDEVNADLRGYKHILSIYPQGRLDADATPMEFSFGVADSFGEDPPVWTDYQTYDARNDYKLDFDTGGRYLAMRMRYTDYKTVSLSGIDLDVEILSDGP
jgi:hypothetical protein